MINFDILAHLKHFAANRLNRVYNIDEFISKNFVKTLGDMCGMKILLEQDIFC